MGKGNFRMLNFFIPPIVLKIKNFFYLNKPAIETWQGHYFSWSEALEKCSGYDNQVIIEKCKNALLKIKNREAVYERDSVLFDKPSYSWPMAALLLHIGVNNRNKLNVVDFGGSLGTTYFQNSYFLNSLESLSWSIVEQKSFVDVGKNYFQDEILNFQYCIEDAIALTKPDVLILSGVLQYLDTPEKWIDKFIHLGIENILIDRTAFIHQSPTRITIQNVPKEIYDASYPAWFFDEDWFLNLFSNNYIVVNEFNSFCDHDVVSYDGKKLYWKGFFLKHK